MVKLSKDAKNNIIRSIENDEPLPDEYRFLLFGDNREIELVWKGKSGNFCSVDLPFQTIEQVDEPRAEKPEDSSAQSSLFSIDERGRQTQGWVNKLIWGDNKLILSSLKHGSMRDEIEKAGGIKLIYIDPPFDVGADFSREIQIGEENITKEANILEEIAYRDTWGKGTDSFIAMIYERLTLMRNLLADDGSIYVHCDYRVSAYMRLILDEIFGKGNFINEIIWKFEGPQSPSLIKFGSKHHTISRYAKNKNENNAYKLYYIEEEEYNPTKYKQDDDGNYFYTIPKGDYTDESVERLDNEGKIYWTKKGKARIKKIITISKDGKKMLRKKKISDVWDITSLGLAAGSKENLSYPTQKPEALLERIIEASSTKGDIVADFFCGSGTTAAVAEKLGRKWIATDLGKFAIHTTRKRIIGIQREMKEELQDYRAFELLNLGKYERQYYIDTNPNLEAEQQEQQAQAKEKDFIKLILKAYGAEEVNGFPIFNGKRSDSMICIGPVNFPVGRAYVENIIEECKRHGVSKTDILGFEFEMGLFPEIQNEANEQGITLALKYIPPQVFDKRAVENGDVIFYDVSYIDFKINKSKGSFNIELTDFAVAYSEDFITKKGGTLKIEKDQLIYYKTDKSGETERKILTENWHDWIDYWAVDFNFERKQEIIRIKDKNDEWQGKWTGSYIFENEWQSFRTKQNRSLELGSVDYECGKGTRKIAVKVVDIFGNDTMKIKKVKL